MYRPRFSFFLCTHLSTVGTLHLHRGINLQLTLAFYVPEPAWKRTEDGIPLCSDDR